MAKVQVRVTMFADPIEVGEDEVEGLRAQGLLVEDDPAAEADAPVTPVTPAQRRAAAAAAGTNSDPASGSATE